MHKINYLDLAIEAAKQLEERAIHHWDYVTWLNHQRPIAYHLYDGCSGVALFLAAVYYVTRIDKYKRLALKAIRPLQRENYVYFDRGKKQAENSLGIATGYPSYIYALLLIGHFLQEDLMESIDYFLARITRKIIEADTAYDVMHGAAGTILSLVKLYENTQHDLALERAILSGEHLVKQNLLESNAPSKRMLTGFSHGAAGISYALLKLHTFTHEPAFKQVAEQLIDYERSVYSKEHNNWPDLRNEKNNYLNSWCHGATGIGLARIASLPYGADPTTITEIETVFSLNQKDAETDVHHLCCGNFGRLEFVLTYAEKLNKAEKATAHDYLRRIRHYLEDKTTQVSLLHHPTLSPGFFRGIAGIGYQYLRMYAPKIYPSILLFE